MNQHNVTNKTDPYSEDTRDESHPYEMPTATCRPDEPKYERIKVSDVEGPNRHQISSNFVNPSFSATSNIGYENFCEK